MPTGSETCRGMQAKRLCFLARRRHDAAARPRHAARASARLPQLNFGCPPTLAGAVQLWEPRTGTDSWHSGSVRVTRNIRRAGAYGRAGWLVIGSRMARGGAPRRRLDTQRYRSSGRRDLSGCLRPCLIAYYDFCFLGTSSREAGFFELPCWTAICAKDPEFTGTTARAYRGRKLGPRKCLQVLYSCQG